MSLHGTTSEWPSMYRHPKRRGPQFIASTREPWERLQDALDAAPGWAVPCRDDGHSNDWLSDDRAAQTRAVAACGGCPLLDACRDYATTARNAPGLWGVWGGRRYGTKTTEELTATAAGA